MFYPFHFMTTQQHPPFLNRTLIFFKSLSSTIVYNFAERENPDACAPKAQIIPFPASYI